MPTTNHLIPMTILLDASNTQIGAANCQRGSCRWGHAVLDNAFHHQSSVSHLDGRRSPHEQINKATPISILTPRH